MSRVMPRDRVFGGEKYRWHSEQERKASAEDVARLIRKAGNLCRVTGSRGHWTIWVLKR